MDQAQIGTTNNVQQNNFRPLLSWHFHTHTLTHVAIFLFTPTILLGLQQKKIVTQTVLWLLFYSISLVVFMF